MSASSIEPMRTITAPVCLPPNYKSMAIQIIPKERQAKGAFNGGEIIENKPIGFPGDGGFVRPYSNLFYWAYAEAKVDSTIGLHPHQGFEIMSFVLKNSIRHFDTKLQDWRPLQAGDVQIIRAGNGISHAEFIAEGGAIFQIWFDPNLSKTLNEPASYDDYKSDDLPVKTYNEISVKTYIGEGSPVTLETPGLEVLRFSFENADFKRQISPDKVHSLYIINGNAKMNGEPVKQDDFIIITDSEELHLESQISGDVFMISSLAKPDYQTYAEMIKSRMRH
jgi:redox-sensitive bicupin YhaK (pirin superfamily)